MTVLKTNIHSVRLNKTDSRVPPFVLNLQIEYSKNGNRNYELEKNMPSKSAILRNFHSTFIRTHLVCSILFKLQKFRNKVCLQYCKIIREFVTSDYLQCKSYIYVTTCTNVAIFINHFFRQPYLIGMTVFKLSITYF